MLDWTALVAKLPIARDAEGSQVRAAVFKAFDLDGDGVVSPSEFDKCILKLVGPELEAEVSGAKRVIARAFRVAKGARSTSLPDDDEGVTKSEFRLLLAFLHSYFSLWAMLPPTSGDEVGARKVKAGEFEVAMPALLDWGLKPGSGFGALDEDGAGEVLFDEVRALVQSRAPY